MLVKRVLRIAMSFTLHRDRLLIKAAQNGTSEACF